MCDNPARSLLVDSRMLLRVPDRTLPVYSKSGFVSGVLGVLALATEGALSVAISSSLELMPDTDMPKLV